MWRDPVATNPDHYVVLMENDQVRVLEYTDAPGTVTTPHDHPDTVMYTLSSFRRRLHADGAVARRRDGGGRCALAARRSATTGRTPETRRPT